MKSIRVKLDTKSSGYNIAIGRGLASQILRYVKSLNPSSLVIVSDRNVAKHASKLLARLLSVKCASSPIKIIVAPGEKSKSQQTLNQIYDRCLNAKHPPDRSAIVIALGGGVVGDLAGYFAATYLRGIRLLQIPTTLLAMVDSSVGGKTGINHSAGKNLIGAFHQPEAVFADVGLLKTLPEREYVAAIAEVIKYGVVLDARLFSQLEKGTKALLARGPGVLEKVVTACVRNKARVVSADPLEEGMRAVLNYGHTIGHAVEKASSYASIRHGEAVSIGMEAAARIGEAKGISSARTCQRQSALLEAYGLPRFIPKKLKDSMLLKALAQDKKRSTGSLRFVLPTRTGSWQLWTCKNRSAALKIARGG